MARMSIDDMIARDTRIDRLARLCGWSRRETRACLEDIWALCYDRVVPYLPAEDIEVTALRDAISEPAYGQGFVAALIAVGLARPARRDDRYFAKKDGSQVLWRDSDVTNKLYLAGAAERVGYLLSKAEAGRQGGKNSGKSRRSKAKQSFAPALSKPQAPTNPPDPVPDSASAPDPASSPERERTPPPARPAREENRRKLIGFAWQYAGQVYTQLGAEGCDPTAPNCWSGMPSADSKPMLELRARIDELLDGQAQTYQAAEAILRRRIDVAAAEGRVKNRRDFMTPIRMWNADSFAIGSSMSPQQVGRVNGKPPLPQEPPRRMNTDWTPPPEGPPKT